MNGHTNWPPYTDEEIEHLEKEGAKMYELYAKENGRPKLSTIKVLAKLGARCARNEITGEVCLLRADGSIEKTCTTVLSPIARCSLLFDEKAIDESWAPVFGENVYKSLFQKEARANV